MIETCLLSNSFVLTLVMSSMKNTMTTMVVTMEAMKVDMVYTGMVGMVDMEVTVMNMRAITMDITDTMLDITTNGDTMKEVNTRDMVDTIWEDMAAV